MSEPSNGAAAPAGAAAPGAPPIQVVAQYVKDLSFENPRAPNSLRPGGEPPKIDVRVDVNAGRIGDNAWEAALTVTVDGSSGDDKLFLVELTYGGVFAFHGLAEEHLRPVLLIECPRLLFPFARAIVSDTIRDGGFPPLLIQPVDFARLYRESMEAEKAGGDGDAGEA